MPSSEWHDRMLDQKEWEERNAVFGHTTDEELALEEDARQDRLFERGDWRRHELWGV